MAGEAQTPDKTNTGEEQKPTTLLEEAGKTTVLGEAENAEEKARLEAEQKLVDADESTLSEEDKGKRTAILKTREEKRLLDTPDDKLNEEERKRKGELVKAKAEADKLNQVPEKYEFKVPEGMILDQPFVDKATPILKELKINQAGAQKLMDLYSENLKATAEKQAQDFNQFLKESYEETVKALGAGYKEELRYVAKVRDGYFSEETREMLDASGLSNNLSFIKDLIKLGKIISEGKLVTGRPETSEVQKSPAEKIYTSHNQK